MIDLATCLRLLLDGLWPQTCPFCDAPLDHSCGVVSWSIHTLFHESCLASLPRQVLVGARPCQRRHGVPVRAWLKDHPAFFALLHAAKYGGRPALLRPMAEGLAACAVQGGWVPRDACLVPVPDDPWRRARRGFSPATMLARHVAARLGCGIRIDLLRRRRAAGPLAQIEGLTARREHQRELWGIGRLSEVPRERSLILVDDQITTGSTLEILADLLGARGNPLLMLCLAAASGAPEEV
jgi:predicted amidophosphoribosyltransferase